MIQVRSVRLEKSLAYLTKSSSGSNIQATSCTFSLSSRSSFGTMFSLCKASTVSIKNDNTVVFASYSFSAADHTLTFFRVWSQCPAQTARLEPLTAASSRGAKVSPTERAEVSCSRATEDKTRSVCTPDPSVCNILGCSPKRRTFKSLAPAVSTSRHRLLFVSPFHLPGLDAPFASASRRPRRGVPRAPAPSSPSPPTAPGSEGAASATRSHRRFAARGLRTAPRTSPLSPDAPWLCNA